MGLQPLLKELPRLSKASKRVSRAFKGSQRVSMEPLKGSRGFWSASRKLRSFPRAFQRAPNAFNHFGKGLRNFSWHPKGFPGLSKVPRGSQWIHPRASEASGELPASSEGCKALFEELQKAFAHHVKSCEHF